MKSKLKIIKSVEIVLPRPLVGYILYDNISNEDMCKALKIRALTEIVGTYRNNWHEDILRILNNRLTQCLLSMKPWAAAEKVQVSLAVPPAAARVPNQ